MIENTELKTKVDALQARIAAKEAELKKQKLEFDRLQEEQNDVQKKIIL